MSIRLTSVIILLLTVLGLAAMPGLSSAAQAENRAGVVIQFPDGTTQTYCVALDGTGMTGLDLLLKTGLDVVVEVQGLGALVCSIGANGCDYPAQPCVCQSYGPNGRYWSYHHLREGKWRPSLQGSSDYTVQPGDVDGWAWSDGSAPPVYTFSQICAAPEAPTPTSTPQPPASPTPTNTAISTFTETPVPTATTVPPTVTPLPPTPTSTPPPVEQPPTATPLLPEPTATLAPTDTSTPPPTATASPTTTATAEPTLTPIPTATNIPSPHPTSTQAAAIPTSTSVPTSTPTATTAVSGESMARTTATLIAAGVLLSVGVWAGVTLLRRRSGQINQDRP